MSLGWKSTMTESPTTGSDRKSTRLNSSHLVISYAVFCLKKKKSCSAVLIFAHPYVLNHVDDSVSFIICHIKNMWSDPLHFETALFRPPITSTTSLDILGR